MGVGLQVAAIASTFSFKEVISIELSEDDVQRTLEAIKISSIQIPPITVKVGRVQVSQFLNYCDSYFSFSSF